MPDKLYGWTGVLGSYYASPRKPEEVNSEEYIRKDSLMKWAKEKQEQMKIEAGGCSNMLAAGKLLAYGEIIEKIK